LAGLRGGESVRDARVTWAGQAQSGAILKEACWRPGGGLRDPKAAIFSLSWLSLVRRR